MMQGDGSGIDWTPMYRAWSDRALELMKQREDEAETPEQFLAMMDAAMTQASREVTEGLAKAVYGDDDQ